MPAVVVIGACSLLLLFGTILGYINQKYATGLGRWHIGGLVLLAMAGMSLRAIWLPELDGSDMEGFFPWLVAIY